MAVGSNALQPHLPSEAPTPCSLSWATLYCAPHDAELRPGGCLTLPQTTWVFAGFPQDGKEKGVSVAVSCLATPSDTWEHRQPLLTKILHQDTLKAAPHLQLPSAGRTGRLHEWVHIVNPPLVLKRWVELTQHRWEREEPCLPQWTATSGQTTAGAHAHALLTAMAKYLQLGTHSWAGYSGHASCPRKGQSSLNRQYKKRQKIKPKCDDHLVLYLPNCCLSDCFVLVINCSLNTFTRVQAAVQEAPFTPHSWLSPLHICTRECSGFRRWEQLSWSLLCSDHQGKLADCKMLIFGI